MITHKTTRLMLKQCPNTLSCITRNKVRDIRLIKITNTKYLQTSFQYGPHRKSPSPNVKPFHTTPYLSNSNGNSNKDSPYWFENEPQQETGKRKFFNIRIPKLTSSSVSFKAPTWKWRSKKAPSTSLDGGTTSSSSSHPETLCDDSVATMNLYQSVDLIQELEKSKQKRTLQNEVSKISASQEEALITEYLKYQKDLASRLGEFWGEKHSGAEVEPQHQISSQASDVKLTAPYNALNRVLDSYSATIDSLSNVHKHLQKYEKFLPQKLMDKIPGFTPQSANASILEGNSENPDIVKVKNVQGLRTLLKNLEEEESRINKEAIKARKEGFREETFKKVFACQFSPFTEQDTPQADNNVKVETAEKVENASTPVRKRWHIPGWDPAHSICNDSLFPSYESIIPGRNVCATMEKEVKLEKKLTKPEIEEALNKLVDNVKESMPVTTDYNKSLYDLNVHLKQNSKLRTLLYEQNLLHLITKELKTGQADDLTRALSRETLTLAGQIDSIPKRGIRILAIDGGGVRAVMTALILKRLQEEAGVPLNEMFDYVIGVSTGSILIVMSIVYKVPLDDCLQMYKLFSLEVFKRNIILGATRLVWSQSFYDSDYWSALLREDLGDLNLSETARSSDIPKMAIVSTATNLPTLTPFVFRNYNLPPNTPSQYPGSCNAKVWEAVRASSAAPGYFEEYKLRDIVHQDGGMIVNNPGTV